MDSNFSEQHTWKYENVNGQYIMFHIMINDSCYTNGVYKFTTRYIYKSVTCRRRSINTLKRMKIVGYFIKVDINILLLLVRMQVWGKSYWQLLYKHKIAVCNFCWKIRKYLKTRNSMNSYKNYFKWNMKPKY